MSTPTLIDGASSNSKSIIKTRSVSYGEEDLYAVVGLPVRARAHVRDENTFRELVDKKVNFIVGIKPDIFYKRLIHRNPFVPFKGLVVKPFSIKPVTLNIGVGERFTFEALNGIGPYTWRCEPETIGIFEDNIFETKTYGKGRIIAMDARGCEATAEIEVVAKAGPVVRPTSDRINLVYRGMIKIGTPSGEEVLAFIEDLLTGKLYFEKSGEEINRFIIKDITSEKLILFNKAKGKEIELFRE